jgi:recombination protein RecR
VFGFPRPLENLVEELMKMPTVGPKTAQRLAFHILGLAADEARALASAILEVKETIRLCSRCWGYTDAEVCEICSDPRRDPSILCIVADYRDIASVERTRVFSGHYHVLGGLISPTEGRGPEDLRIRELMERIDGQDIQEIIFALDPKVGGEVTSLYLSKLLKPRDVKLSRLAYGLPFGSDLEYADEVTLARALEGRREF